MIIIYHEPNPGALQAVDGRGLKCKATWTETNAQNLRAAVGAAAHAPWVWPSGGEIQVEIDGVMFAVDRLPKYGPDLLYRCTVWLENRRRSPRSAIRPVFGL